ncbi:hypothetical protein PUN4_600093 [Paraburkholderia unamae]|nr:hypothetical protein PUN4_600093 [Paraburkholderia unamae]
MPTTRKRQPGSRTESPVPANGAFSFARSCTLLTPLRALAPVSPLHTFAPAALIPP